MVKFQRAMFSYADFAEYWFKNPEDDEKPLRLDPAQRSTINAAQFGYDYEAFDWVIPVEKRPKEIVMVWPRQYGKTTAVAIAAACAFIFMVKRFNIGCFSINDSRAKKLLKRILYFIQESPFAYMIEKSNTTQIYKYGDRVMIESYPASEGCRGESIHFGLVDEAASLTEDVLYGAIIHAMRRVGRRWILLSTPKGAKGTFFEHYKIGMKTRPLVCKKCHSIYDQDSELLRAWQTKLEAGWNIPKSVPACPKCASHSWVYGIGEYTIVPVDPWTSSFKTKEEIIHELDLAGWTPLARQEILGEIIMEGSNVFTKKMLERATRDELKNLPRPDPRIRNYIIGMDFGKVHDASVINVMHYDGARNKAVWDYMESIGGEFDNIDYHGIRERFLDIVMLYDPMWIVPDATGVGDSVVDDMYHDLKAVGSRAKIYSNKLKNNRGIIGMYNQNKKVRRGFIFDLQSKLDLIDNLSEGYGKRLELEIPPYHVPEVHDFWDEMLSFSYEITDSKNIKYGVQAEHDDRVIAHALAYYVCRQKPFIGLSSKLV